MKTTGNVWNAYLLSWPDGQWFDDHDLLVNGKECDDEVKDTDIVTITGGTIYESERDSVGYSLISHFRKWQKAQTETTFVVTVPNGSIADFESMTVRLGARIIK